MSQVMIRFEDVGLRYATTGQSAGPEVLRDISFALPHGTFRWLLGPSGAGKTSLLRLMYLAVRPSRGKLFVLGTEIGGARRRHLPRLRRQIGVVFQDFRLLAHLTAFDNVALPLRLVGRPEGQVRADVTEMLRWVGLARKIDAHPAELSGGEQQRVAIARAVISRPSLLLADEPTGNLDPKTADHVFATLSSLVKASRVAALIATHNMDLAARMDRRVTIRDGRVTEFD